MKIEVRGETFHIDFVSNYVRKLYGELVDFVYNLTELADDMQDALEEFKTDKKKARQIVKKANQDKKDITQSIVSTRWEIIKEIMESNGYEFDQLFWERKTDPDDINQFLEDCLNKDLSEGNKSKKK